MDGQSSEGPVFSRRLMRRAVLVSFAVYFALGLPDGVFGTVWPTLRNELGRTDSSFGWLLACMAVGYTICSVGSAKLSERFGTGLVVRNASFVVVAGLLGVAVASNWWALMFGVLIMGAGWGLCDASINAWMALTQQPRQMGLLHGVYGVGAVLGPLLATVFVAGSNNWRGPFVVVGVLVVGLVVVLWGTKDGFDSAPLTGEVASARANIGGTKILTLLIVWFSVYVGIEVTVGQWSYTFLTESRGLDEVLAGALVSAFWGGLTVGRFLLAAIGDRFSPERVMALAIGSTVIEVAFLWVDLASVGAFALPFIGFSLAAMFPLVIGRTAVYLGSELAARAVGYQVGASSVGFVLLPYLVGALADHLGTGVMAPVTFAAICVLGVLWAWIQSYLLRVNQNR